MECLDLIENAFRWHGEGRSENPPKLAIHPPAARHILAMSALVTPLAAAGMKWVADFPNNHARGLPTITALIVLNDTETGEVLAIMDGNHITAIRTAAVTTLCLRHCMAPNASAVVIVGTGVQARSHVLSIAAALPTVRSIGVVGRTLAAAEVFCTDLQPLSRISLTALAGIEQAVRSADVLLTVTTAVRSALLEPEWLRTGVTAAILDNAGKETRALYAFDRIIVDDRRAFEGPEAHTRFPAGIPQLDAEIGEVVTGRAPGRTSQSERVLVLSLGMAMCDVVVAVEILRRAVALDRGVRLAL